MDIPNDIDLWRKQQRTELLARRMAVPRELQRDWTAAITRTLVGGFPLLRQMTIGFYWPFKGEFDPRFAIRQWRRHGAIAALPLVVAKAAPLEFRAWWPGAPMKKGVFDLPMPDGTPVVEPQALLMPPVGFDAQGYRLGYGGGYFDRTLAARTRQPLKIGVGFELSRIPTIHPQPYDIPMDFIVTEAGVHQVGRDGLELVGELDAVAGRAARIVEERRRAAMQGAESAAHHAHGSDADPRRYASSPFHGCQTDPAADDGP